jgi:hypothetical protein
VLGLISQGAIPIGSFIFGILIDILQGYQMMIFSSVSSAILVYIFLRIAPEETFEPKIIVEEI